MELVWEDGFLLRRSDSFSPYRASCKVRLAYLASYNATILIRHRLNTLPTYEFAELEES